MTHQLALVAALALGQGADGPKLPATLREPLRALQFLVGSCWTGTFPSGTSTDTHCFEPVFNGMFVRDHHVVRGGRTPYEGETVYGWDPKLKKVVYTYWASDGGISTGTMEPGDGEIVFPEAYAADSGQATMKSVWTPRGGDTYDVTVARLTDGQWRETWRMTMRREKPPR